MRALAKCLISLTLLLGIPLTVRAQIEDHVGADDHATIPGHLLQFTELLPPATEESAPMSMPADESEFTPDRFDGTPRDLAPDAAPERRARVGRAGGQARRRVGVGGRAARALLYAPAYTIQGGTNEILRNIIAQRGLGLPAA